MPKEHHCEILDAMVPYLEDGESVRPQDPGNSSWTPVANLSPNDSKGGQR